MSSPTVHSIDRDPTVQRSIEALVATPTPTMQINPDAKPRSTKSRNHVRISLDHLRQMKGFTVENLKAMWEDIWPQMVDLTINEHEYILSMAKLLWDNFETEGPVRYVGRDWIDIIAKCCIRQASPGLAVRFRESPKALKVLPEDKPMVWMLPDRANDKLAPKKKNSHVLGHPGFWLYDANKRDAGLNNSAEVVGDAESSATFNPEVLKYLQKLGGVDEANFVGMVPGSIKSLTRYLRILKQVGTYAWLGRTRYGFILTDTTITFLRYFMVDPGQSPSETVLGLEYSSFDLQTSDQDEMTLSLGLVSFAFMAHNAEEREIVEEHNMKPLDAWSYADLDSGRWYQHPISHQMTKQPPPVEGVELGSPTDPDSLWKPYSKEVIRKEKEQMSGFRAHWKSLWG
ncbi:hypothetical protein F5Y18DRAFT_428131 [Xylariaceae sp. FL1019]|nr:hypothetical protein F5Y18DRAFT_428131 [Xylariaceae sp. FL1019]